MPSINEMIANPVQYGFTGGARQRREDVRTQETHALEQKESKLDIAKKQAEMEDYLAERKTRRAKAEAERLRAERETKYASLLDEQARAQIAATTAQSFSQMHSTQVEDFARQIGGIKNQKQYNMWYNSLDDRDMETLKQSTGWEPPKSYKEAKAALNYIHTIGTISMEYQRALELQSIKANAAAAGKSGAKPGGAQSFGPGSEPQLNNLITQDPFFNDLTTTWYGAADDPAAAALTAQIQTRANEIIKNSNNEARRTGDASKEIGQNTALNMAMEEEKAMRHKMENGKVVPMGIEEFNRIQSVYQQSLREQFQVRYGDRWNNLSAGEQAALINDGFRALRIKQYRANVQEANYE